MRSSRGKVVSAQVLLYGEGGRRFKDTELVAANAAALQAPAAAASAAVEHFREAGFEVGPVVGLGFSITAKASLFEKVFAAKVSVDENGGASVGSKGGDRALDLHGLPKAIQACVAAIEFAEPPDFGPTQYY
jgi:hypothetical protein